MALFLHSLKKSGHLEQIHITVAVVGSRKIAIQDDYGSQGWQIFAPNLTIYGFDADADACEKANAELKIRQINWNEKHIPLALWKCEGKSTLYVTQEPACSSLYPPSEYYIEHFVGNSRLIELADTQKVETTTLDIFCQSENITEIDFIQLDIQGAELPALEGADWILKSGTLAIVSEVEFTELYTGQPLFSDLDHHLRMRGFTLFDINNMNRDIRKMAIMSSKHPGALIWADAFYFRDLIREDLNINLKAPEKIFKLACIADVLDFTDYALELLTHLTVQYGKDDKYNFADNIIESLAWIPGLVKHGQLLSSLPIIEKIRMYSSSYKYKNFSTQEDLRKQGYQYLLLGEYDQAVSIYEKAIEFEPNVKANYWDLGLLLLLQDQEVEAHTAWFVGLAEGKPEEIDIWIAEIVEVLQAEAERREIIGDKALALTINENINTIASQYNE